MRKYDNETRPREAKGDSRERETENRKFLTVKSKSHGHGMVILIIGRRGEEGNAERI